MNKKITTSDIAKLANVNQSTVSRALSPGKAWMISPEKRDEIMKICRKLNYHPRRSGKARGRYKNYKIGFLLGSLEHDLTSAAFTFMLRELCDCLQSLNYTLTLIRVDYTSPKLADNIKRILKSDTVDIYIAGAGLLRGQTMDFMHSMSSRLICYMPFCSPNTESQKYRWISQVNFDYDDAFEKLVSSIPEEITGSMLYISSDITDTWKYSSFKKHLTSRFKRNIELPLVTVENGSQLRDQNYRSTYEMIEKIKDSIKNRKLYICGSYIAAQALTEVFRRDGLTADKDFFIITFAAFSSTADKYFPYRDDFSIFGYHTEYAAEKICDLAMELIDDPLPKSVTVPAVYQPSKSWGGTPGKAAI